MPVTHHWFGASTWKSRLVMSVGVDVCSPEYESHHRRLRLSTAASDHELHDVFGRICECSYPVAPRRDRMSGPASRQSMWRP